MIRYCLTHEIGWFYHVIDETCREEVPESKWMTCDKHDITYSRSYGCYLCRFEKESTGITRDNLPHLAAYRMLLQAVEELLEAEADSHGINLGVYRLSVTKAIDIINELEET